MFKKRPDPDHQPSHLGTRMADEVVRNYLIGPAWKQYQLEKVPVGIAFCRGRGCTLEEAEDSVQNFSIRFCTREVPVFVPGEATILARMLKYLDHRIKDVHRRRGRNPTLRAVSLDERIGEAKTPRHEQVAGARLHPVEQLEPNLKPEPSLEEILGWLRSEAETEKDDEKRKLSLRDVDIYEEVRRGKKQKEVAMEYKLKPSRLSQIISAQDDLIRTKSPWRAS